jgi:hypothetical protein
MAADQIAPSCEGGRQTERLMRGDVAPVDQQPVTATGLMRAQDPHAVASLGGSEQRHGLGGRCFESRASSLENVDASDFQCHRTSFGIPAANRARAIRLQSCPSTFNSTKILTQSMAALNPGGNRSPR